MSAPYRPGQQPQWHDPRQQRPDRPPPIQFHQQGEPQRPKNAALAWSLRGLGLVAVAVISGLVWYYVTNDTTETPQGTGTETTQEQPEGRYTMTPHPETTSPDRVTDCAKHAYHKIREFLQSTPCDHLARQLFTVDVDGRTIYVSVSVVTMPDEEKAADLRKRTDEDGSGNINDVVRDGLVKVEGLDRLSGLDGYAATQSGRDVTIVESDFAKKDRSGDDQADEDILDKVSEDALRYGPQIGDYTG